MNDPAVRDAPLRALVFTSLYPNAAQPLHGLFVERRLQEVRRRHPLAATVVAPVPWFPSTNPRFGRYATFARVPRRETRDGVECLHPRHPVVPKVGTTLAPALMAGAVAGTVRRAAAGARFIDAHFFYPDGVAAAVLARRLGLPLVITARGSDINLYRRFDLPRRMIAWAGAQARAIVAVSDALRAAMIEIGIDGAKIEVIRNGVDLDLFRPLPGAEAVRPARASGRRVLLTVGHLVELKGNDLVVRALAELPDCHLVIAGDGPERGRLEALAAETGVRDRVEFLGAVPPRDLPGWYNAADILVLASSREGMPNVVLEAMACGTPVVATAVGGVPEVVTGPDAGQLAAQRSPEAIAQAVRAVLAHGVDRAATRAHGARFDWGVAADAQWRVYSRVAGAQ